MSRRKFGWLWCALILAIAVAQLCYSASGLQNVPKPSKNYKVAVLLKTLANEWWVSYQEGCKVAAKDYGLTLEFSAAPTEGDVQRQLEILETLIRKDYDALIVSPITETNLLPGLAKATRARIPIILVAEPIRDSVAKEEGISYATFIDADNRGAGAAAAEYLSRKLPKGAKTLIIEGMAGSPGSQARISGFTERAADLGVLKIVASQAGNWDRLTAMNITTNTLKVHPDLACIYAANDDMALGAAEAVVAAGRKGKVLIVGTDAIPSALDAIKDGRMAATVDLDPAAMGRYTIEATVSVLEGVKVPSYLASKVRLITAAEL